MFHAINFGEVIRGFMMENNDVSAGEVVKLIDMDGI